MAKELPSIIYKIDERSFYEKFARQLVKHLHSNLDKVQKPLRFKDNRQIKGSIKYRLFFGYSRKIERIRLEYTLLGLMVDLGVGKGTKLDDIGYQRIGRSLLGRKVNNRRAGRWYLKTAYGQTIRLMNIVSRTRGDAYTVEVMDALKKVENIKINL